MADRLLQAKQDLSQITSEKGGLLRATYAAVRGDTAVQGAAARGNNPTTACSAAAPSSDELAVLGSDGAFRVSAALLGCAGEAVMVAWAGAPYMCSDWHVPACPLLLARP